MKKHRKFKEQKEKPKKFSKQVIYTLIIASLMVFSIVGFTLSNSEQSTENYKDQKFKLSGQKWITKIDGQEFSFYYLPSEVEYIQTNGLTDLKNLKMLYLTFNPNQKYLQAIDLARFDLTNDLISLGIYPVPATNIETDQYELQVITCLNSTGSVPVIEFRESDKTEVSLENSCIILKSDSERNFIKLKDLIIYKIIGIIE
ncbi:hypothetical protein ACFLZ7_04270 [Nanoarchaeota archaeon]